MSANVVLVTGVGGALGGTLLARLSRNNDLERVIGVDTVAPPRQVLDRMGRAEFVRADIRNPLISKIVREAGVDTVVHASISAHPAGRHARVGLKEANVIGLMRLLAACQASPQVTKLVVKSTGAVYGAGPRSPAMFTEQSPPRPRSSRGYVSEAVDMEGYVRGLVRRRPDITVTVARFADLLGPGVDTALSRYFDLPAVPSVFGYDARMQFVHPQDALAVLERATLAELPGVYNVAGAGVLMLSQAIRLAGRLQVPVPDAAVPACAALLRASGLVDVSADQIQSLTHGRVLDTRKLREFFGYVPRWSTRATFEDFARARSGSLARRLAPWLVEAASAEHEAAVGNSTVGGSAGGESTVGEAPAGYAPAHIAGGGPEIAEQPDDR